MAEMAGTLSGIPFYAAVHQKIAAPLQDSAHGVTMTVQYVSRVKALQNHILSRLFPSVLLVCNAGAAICCAMAGDYRRSLYWAASALCIGAITF